MADTIVTVGVVLRMERLANERNVTYLIQEEYPGKWRLRVGRSIGYFTGADSEADVMEWLDRVEACKWGEGAYAGGSRHEA
jgi:hypothetical protein